MLQTIVIFFLSPPSRSDAQRAAKQKERKERELELCAFNAEQIEDSSPLWKPSLYSGS